MVIVYSPGIRKLMDRKTGKIVLKKHKYILKSRKTGRPLGYHMTPEQAENQEKAIWANK